MRIRASQDYNMWTNTFVNNGACYAEVSVSRTLTPNYHTLVEQGAWISPQPYSLSIDRSMKATFTVNQWNGDSISWPEDWIADYTIAYQDIMAKLGSAADYMDFKDNKLLSKLQGVSLPLLQMYKERHETGQLVLGALDKMVSSLKFIRHPKRFVREYRSLHPKRTRASLERQASNKFRQLITDYKRFNRRDIHAGDAFLQYQFAWKPLVLDIMDSIEAAETSEKKHSHSHVSVTFDRTKEVTGVGGRFTSSDLALTATQKVTGFMKVWYSIDDAFLSSVGMIQNLPATLWDLTPYSFVVDWFIGIGDWLTLQTATMGLKFQDGIKSVKTETRITSASNGKQYPWGDKTYWTEAVSCWPERYKLSFQRQILTSFPKAHLMSNFSWPSNPIHIAEGAALLKQLFDRSIYKYTSNKKTGKRGYVSTKNHTSLSQWPDGFTW